MIYFLQSFGAVIVSSKFEKTKGYSPGIFLGSPKKSVEIHLKVNEKRN